MTQRDARGPSLLAMLRRVLRRVHLLTVEVPVEAAASFDGTPIPGLVIRRGTASDTAALRQLLLTKDSVEDRLGRGEVPLVAEMGGQIIGCSWLTSSPRRSRSYRVKIVPRPSSCYHYGIHVLPTFRRKGVATALGRAGLLEAQRLGAAVCFWYVDAFDRPARAVNAALGVVPCEEWKGIVLLDRFHITLERRRLVAPSYAWLR